MKPEEHLDVKGICHRKKHSESEISFFSKLCSAFDESELSIAEKLINFPRFVRRQDMARLLTKYEIFKTIFDRPGSIIECGVLAGAGLFGWMHFSSILEPYNHTRKIIGFDTFDGFPSIHKKDSSQKASEHTKVGALSVNADNLAELERYCEIHDQNRPLGHVEKVEFVKGDSIQTIPRYIEDNPHLLISLLYLNFDLFEPTKIAIEYLLPRVVAGGAIVFDELNCPEFPGETTALLESIGCQKYQIKRFTMDPYISYLTV